MYVSAKQIDMSIGQPINPSQCNNITPALPGTTPGSTIQELASVVLFGSVTELLDGDELLLTLKVKGEFGEIGEYPKMPLNGIIMAQLSGTIMSRDGDVAIVGGQTLFQYDGTTLTFPIPGANIAAITANTGTIFSVTNVLIDTISLGSSFTMRVRPAAGFNITVPFNITVMDLGTLRKFAITPKP